MLKLFTDSAMSHELSSSYKGKVTALVSNTKIRVEYDASKPIITAGSVIYISVASGLPVVRTVSSRGTLPSTPTGDVELTLNQSIAGKGVAVNDVVFRYDMQDPDFVSGPGTNFTPSIRQFYVGMARSTEADYMKRYKNITVSLDTAPINPASLGVTIQLSTDGTNWVTMTPTNSISLGNIGYTQDALQMPQRSLYRKVTVSSTEPLDISWLKYKIEADEYLDYGFNTDRYAQQ